jgi:translation initiation factor 3 subunit F
MDPLYIEGTKDNLSEVQLHPVVLFSILDHYLRREESGEKVIGALLGSVGPGGVVNVTNSFGIFHKATQDEILVKSQTLRDMLELHRRADPNEILVGWYSTWRSSSSINSSASSSNSSSSLHKRTQLLSERSSNDAEATAAAPSGDYIDQFTLVVQDFFAEAASPVRPIHLLIDLSLKSSHIHVVAYQPVLVRNIIAQFERLKLSIVESTEERVAIDAMAQAALLSEHALPQLPLTLSNRLGESRELAPDLQSLESSLSKLKGLVLTAKKFVDNVLSGATVGTEVQGRAIADALSSLPSIDVSQLAGQGTPGGAALDTSMKDLLLVTYLTQLAQVQLKISEKLSVLPLSI